MTTTLIDPKERRPGDVYEVVNEYTLSERTRDGWELVAVLDCESVHVPTLSRQTPPKNEPSSGYYDNPSQRSYADQPESHVVREKRFLVRQSVDEKHKAMLQTLDELSSEIQGQRGMIAQYEADKKKAAEEKTKLERDIEAVRQRLDRSIASEKTVRTNQQKLEADLAKIRREIGEARWREIIGGGST